MAGDIIVEGPDGQRHSFPAGTTYDTINQVMEAAYPPQGGGPAGPGVLEPFGLPRPGQATPASGAVMPSSQSIPDYRTDEDWENIMLGMMLPRGAASLVRTTPGHEMRERYAQGVGTNMAKLEERQRAGDEVLDSFQRTMRTLAAQAQRNGSINGAIGPVQSSPTFQRAREAVNVGNVLGTREGYNTSVGMQHAVHALTDMLMSAGMATGTMSDARMKVFEDAIGAALNASDVPTFNRIMSHAEQMIRGQFELPHDYVPRSQRREMLQARASGTPYVPPWERDDVHTAPAGGVPPPSQQGSAADAPIGSRRPMGNQIIEKRQDGRWYPVAQ